MPAYFVNHNRVVLHVTENQAYLINDIWSLISEGSWEMTWMCHLCLWIDGASTPKERNSDSRQHASSVRPYEESDELESG